MNVLIISPLYYIEGRSDLIHDTNAVHYLVKYWSNEHNVYVVMTYFQPIKYVWRYMFSRARKLRNGYYYEVDNVKVALIEIQKLPKQGPTLLSFQCDRVIKFVLRFMKDNGFKPDVVVAHNPLTNVKVVNKIFIDIPKVAVLHNTDKKYWDRRSKDSGLVSTIFDDVYVRSSVLHNFFRIKGVNNLRDEIIYSGAPMTENGCRLQQIVEPIKIMYAGKLIKQKNVDVIIKAMSVVQKTIQCKLEIYGDGKYRRRLTKLAKKNLLNGSYSFMGCQSREKILDAMNKADFFIMPSTNETFGLVYLEAMSKGCITIGTKGEGIDGTIIDGENGFLVNGRDYLMLADIIVRVFNASFDTQKRLRQNGFNTALLYEEKKASEHYYATICRKYELKI